MEMMDVIRSRHSVRQYLDKQIPQEIRRQLDACAASWNEESGLHMQILYDEPECFQSRMAHYGKFEHADNYIAMVGKKGAGLEECCGFYGEKLVLKAQELGLNTCWVALTHGKSKAALLAPTAINQQKFRFERDGNRVTARAGKIGTQLKVDLGIVKCHFELGAGKENFEWG